MRRISILGSIVAAVSLLAVLGSAQDSHYWTYQYGTRSNLLGGAVIGSVLDLSGTYYNPGGLSLIETEAVELLMFAKVFHFPTISIEGLGPEDLIMSEFRRLPRDAALLPVVANVTESFALALASMKQSGFTVTVFYIMDRPGYEEAAALLARHEIHVFHIEHERNLHELKLDKIGR